MNTDDTHKRGNIMRWKSFDGICVCVLDSSEWGKSIAIEKTKLKSLHFSEGNYEGKK